jgi:hypothetical protein
MPGLVMLTDLEREPALSAAARAARDLGFDIQHVTDREFLACRSSLGMSLLLPPFTPYCKFRVSVLEAVEAGVELVLQRNSPWWTGFFGLRGVKTWFDKLAGATEQAVESAGGKVLNCREI